MPGRCPVCGFETPAAVCPRCSTILLREQAICPKCGKMFRGWLAACDACGTAIPEGPGAPARREAEAALASVPGISEARARELAAHGFRDFADVLRLALPESAVEKGLHHAIARRVLLSAIATREAPHGEESRCPVCGTAWSRGEERCRACGSSMDRAADLETFQQKMQEVTGELVDFAADPDFREMPAPVREELLKALGDLDEGELLADDYRRQIEAWARKGFDVAPLETLLAEDPAAFREKSVRIIRAQMMKKADAGLFRCPLCEVRLPASAETCENCGARFG